MAEKAAAESSVSHTTTRTAIGDIDTITVAPKGDSEVEVGEGGSDAENNGVVISDKVAARQQREAGGDGGEADEGDGEPENRNLSDDVGQKGPVKKPFKKTRDGRINELTGKLRETERTASDYQRELEEERAKSARLAAEKEQSDHAAVLHWRDRLKAEIGGLTRELKDAKDKADTDKEAEIQTKMTEAQVQLGQAQGWLDARKKPEGAAPAAEKPAPEKPAAKAQPERVTYQGEAARWVSENPWFEEGSGDYDAGMARFAKNYATYLENELDRVGNTKAIGSKEYFEAIDAQVRRAFPDRFGDDGDDDGESEKPAAPAARGSAVAPVRPSQPGIRTQQPTTNANKVTLSQEEREVAHALILKHPDGRSFSPREKEVAYARSKQSMKKGA